MREFKAGPFVYRAGKISAIDQLILVKTLAGTINRDVVPELIATLGKFKTDEQGKHSLGPEDLLTLFMLFAQTVGRMPDQDFKKILGMCLPAVQRKQDDLWSPVQVDGTIMFSDISSAQMIFLTYKVLEVNLGGFFDELPSILGLGETPQK